MTEPARKKPLTFRIRDDGLPVDIDAYERTGGYQGLRRALRMAPQEVQHVVDQANLLGRGGAGFPAGRKWAGVAMGAKARRPKYVLANADEMEPGSMKDRLLMEADPHQLVEGLLIAAYAIEAEYSYIFVRRAYREAARRLERAIEEARGRGYIGKQVLGSPFNVEMYIHVSNGRYMCGEGEGLMDALEGKRAIPRSKPPHAAQCGLWGKPTIVNNVETLCCVGPILAYGPQWFLDLSLSGEGGTKLYGISGHVKRTGLWELPMGTPLREVLYEKAGGMQEGYAFRGVLPGGASSSFLVDKHLDVPLDFASLDKAGSRMGTGTLIVMDNRICPVGVLVSIERFFARESCGWCTPCREGLPWVRETLEVIEAGDGRPDDLAVLEEHVEMLSPPNTFCAMAPGAVQPLKGALEYFRDDFERHIREKRCPWR